MCISSDAWRPIAITTWIRSSARRSPSTKSWPLRNQWEARLMEAKLELWGGVECTINRVGHRYFNQLALSGHWERADQDLERFAALGLRTLRFPLLWESLAPHSLEQIDWS